MADYYSLISRAITALPQPTPDARQAVYERARKALFNQLRGIQPPVAEADIAIEGRALEEAITRLEIELAVKPTPAPAAPAPAPGAAAPPRKAPPPGAPPRPEPAEPAKGVPRDAAAPTDSTPPRDNDVFWRETLASAGQSTPADAGPREPQRPPAPLPPLPDPASGKRRILAVSAVLIVLIGVVGLLAWQLRERPEDLAKLKPEASSASDSAEGGKFADRVDGDPTAPTARGPGGRGTPVAVAQKAEMWVASLQEPNKVDKIYAGTVLWRLDNVGGAPGETVGSAIRGEIDIPDGKLKMTLVFQKNTDATLSASHTINVSFKVAPDGPLKGVKAIGPIQMRRAEAQSGEKVVGIPVPITENNFLIGLMRGDREARNLTLLRSLMVLDLPLQLTDGRAATINMEKGPTGERVFADALDAWSR